MREQADQKRDSFWFVVLFFVSETSSYDTKTLRENEKGRVRQRDCRWRDKREEEG